MFIRDLHQIVVALEKGVPALAQPWNVEHSAGRITRLSRGNGIPYQGINVLMLRSAAVDPLGGPPSLDISRYLGTIGRSWGQVADLFHGRDAPWRRGTPRNA